MTDWSTRGCSVREATHVKLDNGVVEKIVSKWGIGPDGQLAKLRDGGFGVVTESGRRVTMLEAHAYYKMERK